MSLFVLAFVIFVDKTNGNPGHNPDQTLEFYKPAPNNFLSASAYASNNVLVKRGMMNLNFKRRQSQINTLKHKQDDEDSFRKKHSQRPKRFISDLDFDDLMSRNHGFGKRETKTNVNGTVTVLQEMSSPKTVANNLTHNLTVASKDAKNDSQKILTLNLNKFSSGDHLASFRLFQDLFNNLLSEHRKRERIFRNSFLRSNHKHHQNISHKSNDSDANKFGTFKFGFYYGEKFEPSPRPKVQPVNAAVSPGPMKSNSPIDDLKSDQVEVGFLISFSGFQSDTDDANKTEHKQLAKKMAQERIRKEHSKKLKKRLNSSRRYLPKYFAASNYLDDDALNVWRASSKIR
ncbi:hypothetical protein HELRODRAFT_169906 [Helobdella robusta]|uniref:Uncharacterized protein n=1 Tax=Helobdella robusta TaxID=6412 RepID=T1F2F5_HELRO|nr:hypothetical protein HELRODRAFT_169906 [Helobdella robusta]ESO08167.1 hypothetical protein HELRODRAFT_169906 [Helobdella robusta]